MKLELITKNDESFSKNKLSKFYENDLIPSEKKNYLTMLEKSQGPYLAVESEEGTPHYFMDAASQIATLGLGFSPNVFMGTAHILESWTNRSDTQAFTEIRTAFESFLKRKTNWDKIETTFCNSGAEANEIALGYAYNRRINIEANQVLALEGSFHGRMLVTLASTWNKSKREPFEWPGYQTHYSPSPELSDSNIIKEVTKEWRTFWDQSVESKIEPKKDWLNDSGIKKEYESLLNIKEALDTKKIFAIIVEPMQCEGGDKYLTNRYFTGLLLLARSYGVEVIFDEVQTGFHLGNEFFWHRMFNLQDNNENQLNPDYLVCAKKAQIGLVCSPNTLSKSEFEKSEEFQVASVVRGYLHAISLDQSQDKIKLLENWSNELLRPLVNNFSEHIENPRAMGMCFAIDLKEPSMVAKFIAKRFDHGLLYYPAGSRTLRFRLNLSFTKEDVEFLFHQIQLISDSLFNEKNVEFPSYVETKERALGNNFKWQELLLKSKLSSLNNEAASHKDTFSKLKELFSPLNEGELLIIDESNFSKYSGLIETVQKEVYEPTRQTSIENFEKAALNNNGTCLILEKNGKINAMAFCAPLNIFPYERGLRQSNSFSDEQCVYMLDTTVSAQSQGHGLGKMMKYGLQLLSAAKGIKQIHGRNRDRLASGMLNINLSLGSYEHLYFKEDYPDDEKYRDVIYYKTNLQWEKPLINLSNSIKSPLTTADLTNELIIEQLPYLINKVCLSNFVSERFLSQVQDALTLLPKELQHGYTTSGQSECVDKIAKAMWFGRAKTHKMLTIDDHYFGNGSFLSRSLSSPEDNFFPVDRVQSLTDSNENEVLKNIEEKFKSSDYLAFWVEPVPQNTMDPLSFEFLQKVRTLCTKYKVFLVFNETASCKFNYASEQYFASGLEEITPDAGMNFLGGQAGLVFATEEIFLEKPLMMISTWDGDEFSFCLNNISQKQITENKDEYFKIAQQFQDKLTQELKKYNISDIYLLNGKGWFEGVIPYSLQKSFICKNNRYLVNPSFSAMKEFIGV